MEKRPGKNGNISEIIFKFYKNKNILITGHTGFKGSWLCQILLQAGANITGYSLESNTTPNLFKMIKIKSKINSIIGDIRDFDKLQYIIKETKPEIIFHLAAQPLVRESYRNPRYTFETNVMGTVNILESIRNIDTVKSLVNVTTDKVYRNNEWCWGYREDDYLDGQDPYSNSKSCSELVTHSYKQSFFESKQIAISTARAGNVIGGGDFSIDRIIPDCIRSAEKNEPIIVRNPNSIRPYQHVLEPLSAYLLIAKKQYENIEFADNYNIGPDDKDCITTGNLVSLFCKEWGENIKWINQSDNGPHEANFLKLDCSKIKSKLYWSPKWDIETAVYKTIEFVKYKLNNQDVIKVIDNQIDEYFS